MIIKESIFPSKLLLTTCFCACWLVAPSLLAHENTQMVGGFVSGFIHPAAGLDHIVAMIAVGLWGAFLGPPAIWLLPVIFPMVMALGGILGILGIPLFAVEIFIALSAVALGGCILFAFKPPLWIAVILVCIFAVFHGFAHGTELPTAVSPMAYSAGFVIATGLIHLLGIAFGLLVHFKHGKVSIRALGLGIALVGGLFLVGVL